jgi:hypothetical protein
VYSLYPEAAKKILAMANNSALCSEGRQSENIRLAPQPEEHIGKMQFASAPYICESVASKMLNAVGWLWRLCVSQALSCWSCRGF